MLLHTYVRKYECEFFSACPVPYKSNELVLVVQCEEGHLIHKYPAYNNLQRFYLNRPCGDYHKLLSKAKRHKDTEWLW